MITFRDYQIDIIVKSCKIIQEHGFVYLAMEVRTGKTLTSLGIANRLTDVKRVLFITKKKAISSIEADYDLLEPYFDMDVINYESLHHYSENQYDLVICDEAHSMSSYPKPSKRAKDVKNILKKNNPYVILLSGTPTPESYSQMYHQVYGIKNNPFSEYKNFYRFCDDYVNVTSRPINGMHIKDYSKGRDEIIEKMKAYTISFTQKEAGFSTQTNENVLMVKMLDSTYALAKRLKKDLVVQGKDEVILADTPVKLMMKLHQIFSGTIKFESGNGMVLDTSKAEFIASHFENKKLGIFYKFKQELECLKQVFGDELTTELSEFDSGSHQVIALQIVSGREGISLRNADYIVFYNIDFSATSYWQAKDRMTTKERLNNDVYWVFSEGGIEKEIYKAVTKKKDYTIRHFKNDFN